MVILDHLSSFLEYEKDLLRDFYHLDYWETRTLSQGYAEASEELTDLVHTKLENTPQPVQAVAGTGLGMAQLVGAIPIGLNDWAFQVMGEVPNGVDRALYKFVEIPVSGFAHGTGHVLGSGAQWVGGSLWDKDSFEIAHEVTGVLGTAVLLASGTEYALKGGGRVVSAFGKGELILQTGPSAAVVGVGIDGAAVAGGFEGIGQGALLMAASGSRSGGNGKGKKGPAKEKGPVDIGEKIWEHTFGRLPKPWNRRAAWGAGIGAAGLAAAEFLLPERYKPGTLWEGGIDLLFPDLEALEGKLQDPNNEEVAKAAAQRLGEIGNAEALKILQSAKVENFWVREEIGKAIDRIAVDSGWIEKLEKAEDPKDKIEAIEELRKIGGNKAIEVLVEALAKGEDDEVDAHLKLAIHRMKHLSWPIVAKNLSGKKLKRMDGSWWERKKLNDQLKVMPEDETLWRQLGQTYEAMGEKEEAEEAFQKATEISMGSPPATVKNPEGAAKTLNDLGLIALEKGNPEEAINYFREAIKYQDHLAEAWTNLGKALEKAGDLDAAAEAYQQAFLLLEKPDPAISFSLGNAYFDQQEYGLAILMYHEGIRLEAKPEDLAKAYNSLGLAYYKQNNRAWEAPTYFNAALDIMVALNDRRGMAQTYNNMGNFLKSKRDWTLALESYQKALEASASIGDRQLMAQTYNNIGDVFVSQGDLSEALEYYQKALETAASIGDRQEIARSYYSSYGVFNADNWDKGFDYYKKNLTISKSHDDQYGMAMAYFFMGYLEKKKGNTDQAIKYVRQALEIFRELKASEAGPIGYTLESWEKGEWEGL